MSNYKTRKLAFYAGLAIAPATIGALVGRAKRSTLAGSVAGGLTALAMLGVRAQMARWFTEEPEYEIEDRKGPLEIRRYYPQVTATTRVVTDDYDAALQQGFRRLAGYIFGDNFNGEKIGMTSPVSSRAANEHIEMTSPVIAASSPQGFDVSFVMPRGRALESLPTPNDSTVELERVPERRVAVLRFRGRYRGTDVSSQQRELMHLVENAKLLATSPPMFAGFDPPMTLPFLRRNEVWVELAANS